VEAVSGVDVARAASAVDVPPVSAGALVAGAIDVSVLPVTGTDWVGWLVTVANGEATAAGGTGVLVEHAAMVVTSIKATPKVKVLFIFSLL
jgi:hypothetical protein